MYLTKFMFKSIKNTSSQDNNANGNSWFWKNSKSRLKIATLLADYSCNVMIRIMDPSVEYIRRTRRPPVCPWRSSLPLDDGRRARSSSTLAYEKVKRWWWWEGACKTVRVVEIGPWPTCAKLVAGRERASVLPAVELLETTPSRCTITKIQGREGEITRGGFPFHE